MTNLRKILAIIPFRITHRIHKDMPCSSSCFFCTQTFANLHQAPFPFLASIWSGDYRYPASSFEKSIDPHVAADLTMPDHLHDS